jgi:hypothetical protein
MNKIMNADEVEAILKRYRASQNIRKFQEAVSRNYSSLLKFYRNSTNLMCFFEIMLQSWVEIAKRMLKVRHSTVGKKKVKHCIRVCRSIILKIFCVYSQLLITHPSIRFEHMLQRLYVFDEEMAYLLLQIVIDVLKDERFQYIEPYFEKATLRFFFGWDPILLLGIQKNISFYLKQQMLMNNSRNFFLITSGWIKLLIRKFKIAKYYTKKSEAYLRMVLFNRRRFLSEF